MQVHSALTTADFCNIAATLEPQGTDAESKAKPEIWTSWDDSLAKADVLAKAAAALDATSLEGVHGGHWRRLQGLPHEISTIDPFQQTKISRNRRG